MKQTTLAKPSAWIEGYSLTKHERARVRFLPAPPDTGVVFQVLGEPNQTVKCDFQHATYIHRWTSLATPRLVINHTEHILSALTMAAIDNVRIEVDGVEIPLVTNGSSRAFVDELKKAGQTIQDQTRAMYVLKEPFAVVDDQGGTGSCLLGLPASEFDVSYLFQIPQYPELAPVVRNCFPNRGVPDAIIDARTYLLEHEIAVYGALLHEKVQEMLVVGPTNGAASCREAANHKVLDLIGDLRCLGLPVVGRFVGIRSGHRLNIQAVKHMASAQLLEEIRE